MQPVESSSHLLLLYMYTCTCSGTSVNSNICNSSPLFSPFSLFLFPSPHPQPPSLRFSISLYSPFLLSSLSISPDPLSPSISLSVFPPSLSFLLFTQASSSFGTSDDSFTLWQEFESKGQLSGASSGSYVTGAASASMPVAPNGTAEITIVLGWFFPDKDFLGLHVGMCTYVHTYIRIQVYNYYGLNG